MDNVQNEAYLQEIERLINEKEVDLRGSYCNEKLKHQIYNLEKELSFESCPLIDTV